MIRNFKELVVALDCFGPIAEVNAKAATQETFVINIKLKGDYLPRLLGPFDDYCTAEDMLACLPSASECEHKYIQAILQPGYWNL